MEKVILMTMQTLRVGTMIEDNHTCGSYGIEEA
jgi:hypothetical protein